MTHPFIQKLSTFIAVILVSILAANSSLVAAADDKDTTSEAPKEEDPAAVVEMTNTMKFTADTVKIKKGETVKWKNTSLLAHSVTADPSVASNEGSVQLPEEAGSFDSGMLDPDQTFTHTFNTPGTYQYFCIPHEGAKMFGWVIVAEE